MEVPITQLTHAEILARAKSIKGWVHPSRSASSFIPAFSKIQQAAINLWGWAAILAALSGLILPFVLGSWWWFLMMPLGFAIWSSNRKTAEQFFIENLQSDPAFFSLVQASKIGDQVKVVFSEDRVS